MAQSSADAKDAKVLEGWNDSSIAQKYARGERATKPFSDILVQKSGLANAEGESYVLDIAAGTGAVEASIYEAVPKEKWDTVKVLGTDISESMLQWLKARGEKQGWTGLETRIVDAKDIKLPPNTYTHLFVNFGIFMLPPTTFSTLYSLLQPSGYVGITSWSDLAWIPLVDRAISRLPAPRPYSPTRAEIFSKIFFGQPWDDPAYLEGLLKKAGFEKVEMVMEERVVEVGAPEQFMDPMHLPLMMIGMHYWEEGSRDKWIGDVKESMLEVIKEDAGGEGKVVKMKFSAIMGMGWKA